jgi:hypothetical protein
LLPQLQQQVFFKKGDDISAFAADNGVFAAKVVFVR